MTPQDSGPEPTGWELMRAITRLERVITDSANAAVQQKVYDADKKGNDERHGRSESRIRDLEATNAREAESKRAQLEEAERVRRTTKLSISLAVASPFIAAAVGLILNGITL